MSMTLWIVGGAMLLVAVGLWLLLPRGQAAWRWRGALPMAIGLGLLASRLPGLEDWTAAATFYLLAAITVLSAVGTVTFRSPVYSAIWFALALVGTAGLFLFQGAQFLGVATIVVYAGAILVTFLFVLMLAQPEGDAAYDRLSWSPALAALSAAAMTAALTLAVVGAFSGDSSAGPSDEALAQGVLADEHVAHLGSVLFSRYLVPIEVAGTLLLVALVGAVAIVSHMRRDRPGRLDA